MIRLIDNKLATALDTRDWLAGIQAEHEPDEEIDHMLFVLDALIVDYRRVIDKKKLDERSYYEVKAVLSMAAILLEEFLAEHVVELADWAGYGSVPLTMHHLIAEVLNMAVDQFTESTTSTTARRRDFQPLTDAELAALLNIL